MRPQATGPRVRVQSEKKIDLRTLVIPPQVWQPQQRCDRKVADKEGRAVGFMRVPPDMSLKNVRAEMPEQLSDSTLPKDFVFLRCVGDFLTVVSQKQETTLKAKTYTPPYTSTPDMFVLSTECMSPEMVNSLTSASGAITPLASPTAEDGKELSLQQQQLDQQHQQQQQQWQQEQEEREEQTHQHRDTIMSTSASGTEQYGTASHNEAGAARSLVSTADLLQPGSMASLSSRLISTPSPSPSPFGDSAVSGLSRVDSARTAPAPLYGGGLGVSQSTASGTHLSISLSPTPSPRPPSEPRDPSIPRSPRLERMRQERRHSGSPQPGHAAPPRSPLADSTPRYSPFPPTESHHMTLEPGAYTTSSSALGLSTTSPVPPVLSATSTMGYAGTSPSLLPPTGDFDPRQSIARSDASAMPIQLLLNQGAGEISLQLGGSSEMTPSMSPSGTLGLGAPAVPRLDIRIASPSPWNQMSPLPPLPVAAESAGAPDEERPPPSPPQDKPDARQRGSDSGVEQDRSPTVPLGSRDVFAQREAFMKSQQQESDKIRAQVEEVRRVRMAMEQRKRELIEASKGNEKELQRQKQAVDEEWKKKYLQEKRRTVPLENEVDNARRKYAALHSKPAQQRGRKAMKDTTKATSDAINSRAVCDKLEAEIEALRARVQTLHSQLDAEQKARTQMTKECKQLREELTDKKITKTLIRKP